MAVIKLIKFCDKCGHIFKQEALYCSEHDSKWLIQQGKTTNFCGQPLSSYHGSDEEIEEFIQKLQQESNTDHILQLLQELDEITIDFDVTIDASNTSNINRIARFCGERAWEFYVYHSQTEEKKLVRVRK